MAPRMAPAPARMAGPFALLALLAGAAACADTAAPDVAVNARPSKPPPPAEFRCDADNGGLTLPAGFCATVFADGVGAARHLAVSPAGYLYVALAGAAGTPRGVLALRDRNGDGRADETASFGSAAGNGIAWYDRWLYFAENDRVVRYAFKKGSTPPLAPTGSPTVVVSGLPADRDHRNKSIAISGAGTMYVNVGSATNSCQRENRSLESPGIDPCPELATRSGIWTLSASAVGLTQPQTTRHATGLRNTVALAVEPTTGVPYGVQMNRDNLYDDWPALYSPEDDARLPSEELVRIVANADFGWPYCYHDPQLAAKVLAPEYGGDGSAVGRCAGAALPSLVFPAHWAPLSMAFYTGTRFPSAYRGGAFVAFHGDYFTDKGRPNASPGYLVAYVPFADGQPSGGYTVFADGFIGAGTASPSGAEHRPTGLAVAPDGALFIADDKGGRIWRVVYQGP